MIYFVTVLRALAAMIITNSHYTGVYPTDLIANGGLLGDVIFFAVSGFCLYNPKQRFLPWYGKRILRIYPQVWILTGLYCLLTVYTFSDWFWPNLFFYPTNFHFVASIILLYIPFYFLMRWEKAKQHISLVLFIVAAAWLLCYIFFVDKSYYHIDTVREPFIRFLFGESMLLGVYFRLNLDRFRNKNKLINWVLLVLSAGIYLATKLAFSKIESISTFQILNQCTLLLVLYLVFRCFAGIDAKLEALPRFIKRILEFIAEITLEIYLVQIGIIPFFAKLLPFPLNWLVLTSVIVAGAAVLHFGTKKLIEALQLLFRKLFRKKAK